MAIINSYPTVTPSTTDLLVIADQSDANNPTKTVTIGSILNLSSAGSGLTGAGAAGQVTFWNDTNSITGSNNLFFDTTIPSLGIGTNTPSSTSILDLTSTTAGFLPPRMTTAQRLAISNPAEALIVYDIDERSAYIYSGQWVEIGGNSYTWAIGGQSGGATVASGTNVLFEGDGIITTGYNATSNILTITGNALASVSAGPGITVSTVNSVATVGVEYTGASNLISDAPEGDILDVTDEFLYLDKSENEVRYIDIQEIIDRFPAGSNTTYTFQTAPTGTALRLNGNDSSVNDVTISGTTNETDITRISSTELRVGLTDDVNIAGDVTIGGELTVSGTGNSIFNGQVTIPQSPSVGTDAASKAYVDSVVGGVNGFQGGYDANTNTPALTGGSNIGLSKGNFYVVTVGGSFFTETLEVGDFIFANDTIASSSTPALSDYTVVIADENIAAAGATDAGTQKGVAGFDEDFFTVTANGWVQSKTYAGGANQGVVPTGGGATTFLAGNGTWQTPAGTSYSAATASALGLIKLGSDVELTGTILTGTAGVGVSQRIYPVQFDANDNAAVYVPWQNNNNTYSAGIGLELDGSQFNCQVDATQQVELPNAVVNVQDRCFAIQEQETTGNLVVNVPYKTYTGSNGLATLDEVTDTPEIVVDYEGNPTAPFVGNIVTAADDFNTTGNTVSSTDRILMNSISLSKVYSTTIDKLSDYFKTDGRLMSSTEQGEAKLFSDIEQTVAATAVSAESTRTYGSQLNNSDQLVVNVPWKDTDAGDGLIKTNSSTINPIIAVDYEGNDNIILTASAGSTALERSDNIIVNIEKLSNTVHKIAIEDILNIPGFAPPTYFSVSSNGSMNNNGNFAYNTQGFGTITSAISSTETSDIVISFAQRTSTSTNYMVNFTISGTSVVGTDRYSSGAYILTKTATSFTIRYTKPQSGTGQGNPTATNFILYD